jgi:hypothetical protein
MSGKKIDIDYYENTDFGDELAANRDKIKFYPKKTKRITMNISKEAYEKAKKLDEVMVMGYQNVLKTAILLGLKDLNQILEKEKKKKK